MYNDTMDHILAMAELLHYFTHTNRCYFSSVSLQVSQSSCHGKYFNSVLSNDINCVSGMFHNSVQVHVHLSVHTL
jgi:hypothetical protein